MNRQQPSAFLSIGFRPFYLGAACFAAVSIPLWAGAFLFALPLPSAYPVYFWHAHEMLFGFAVAVIAGFLLTAVRNWTAQPTPSGWVLGSLFGLWLLGRLTAHSGSDLVFALVDGAFLPWLVVSVALPIYRSRNWRNGFVVAVLLVLCACNVAFHAAALGWLTPDWIQTTVVVTADVVMLLMIMIGGRIIPAFSANAIPGLRPRQWPVVEVAAIGLVLLILLLDIVRPVTAGAPGTAYTVVLYVAGAAHLLRLFGWRVWETRRDLLLLVLPLSYFWIPIHLLLRAHFGGAPGTLVPLAAHALFVGAMAGLMLSMMTRSALGHTGRPLKAGRVETVCFVLIQLAALFRVLPIWLAPDSGYWSILLSASCWFGAFFAFVIGYAPILVKPRITAPPATQAVSIQLRQ